jgi:hypothetical protein
MGRAGSGVLRFCKAREGLSLEPWDHRADSVSGFADSVQLAGASLALANGFPVRQLLPVAGD